MIKILGLARKAGKVVIGTDLTVNEVRKNRVKVVLLASDASNNTKKLIYDKCQFYKVFVIDTYSSAEISNSIGKENIKVIGISDEGFSKLLLSQKKEVMNYGQKTNEEQ